MRQEPAEMNVMSESARASAPRELRWKALVCEAGETAREAVRAAADGVMCKGRRVKVVFAQSAAQAQEELSQLDESEEWAACLFSSNAGSELEWLELARWLREERAQPEMRLAMKAPEGFYEREAFDRLDLLDFELGEDLSKGRLASVTLGLARSFAQLSAARRGERAMEALGVASQALSVCKSAEEFADELSRQAGLILRPLAAGAGLLDQSTGGEGGSRRALISASPLPKALLWADLKKAEAWQLAAFDALKASAQSAYASVALQQRLESFAFTDPITGLANRRSFSQMLEAAMEEPSEPYIGVCVYDLDHFKALNDRLGHQAGDKMLSHVGSRMAPLKKAGKCEPARMGGDEFAALFLGESPEAIAAMAQLMFEAVMKPVSVGPELVMASVSAGLSILKASSAGSVPSEALRQADLALYQAKREGRGRMRRYEAEGEEGAGSAKSERSLRFEMALAQNELELHFQPKVRIKTGELCGFEALVRWRHPQEGLIPPMEFLPMAQELGLMDQVDLWVAREASRQCSEWEKAGLVTNIHVNLAPEHMQNKSFMKALMGIFERRMIDLSDGSRPRGRMGVEIVESSALSDLELARGVITSLRDLGLRVALDDFGTGYSSLSYLRRLPLDELKIDQSFVRAMLGSREDYQIVQSVIQLAGIFGLDTVAEGVENTEVARQLHAMGCGVAQGYGIAKPLPAKEAFAFAQRLAAGEALRDWHWTEGHLGEGQKPEGA